MVSRSAIDITHTRAHRARENTTRLDCADLWTCLRVGARSMRTGGMRVGNRCYIQAGTQISPSSRVARRLCCEDPATCLYREACSHYTEPVPVAARGGELGAPGSCADHRTCSHVRNCRYEDEGVSMGRARERAVCACDVVWVLKGSDARRHPRPPRRRRRPPSDPRQEAASADRASPWLSGREEEGTECENAKTRGDLTEGLETTN